VLSCADTNIDILVSIIDGALVLEKDGRDERDGFRGLWRKVKPQDKPDEVRFFPPRQIC